MFAAASGARLAHRHNKTVKKQISASQIEGLQIQCKSFQRQHQLKYSDAHGNRFAGVAHRRPDHATKLYIEPNLKLSSSYVDINGRIAKLGHIDFEGKAAWQDRELNQELEQRVSICVPNEAAITHRTKQREAHSRWVKRNRIHDLSFGDCSSDEEFLYGVQNGAANLLLYVGLGTMCVGMIIAFVGTGEKGFKTMELRLIGPSLIGAGVLIIIFRIMLCVCPSKCLRLKKHKQKLKNSANKLNSEGLGGTGSSKEGPGEEERGGPGDGRKRVSIATVPTTSGLGADFRGDPKTPNPFAASISYLENEKPKTDASGKYSDSFGNRMAENVNFELKKLNGNCCEVANTQSNFFDLPETLVSPDNSDVSITSLIDISPPCRAGAEVERSKEMKLPKFNDSRSPKNSFPMEIVLDPSSLNNAKDTQ